MSTVAPEDKHRNVENRQSRNLQAVGKKKDDSQSTLPGWDELSYLGVG